MWQKWRLFSSRHLKRNKCIILNNIERDMLQILRSRLIIQDLREYQLLQEFWEVIFAKIPVVSAGTRYNIWNTETDKTQSLSIRLDTKTKKKPNKPPHLKMQTPSPSSHSQASYAIWPPSYAWQNALLNAFEHPCYVHTCIQIWSDEVEQQELEP